MDNKEIRRQHLLKEIAKSGTIDKLALTVDISPSYLSQIKNQSRNMGSKIARKIEEKLGHKEGSFDIPSSDTEGSGMNVTVINRPSYSIPLISWISAGAWCESPDNYAPGDAEDWFAKPPNAGPSTFALKVVGDSMTNPYPSQRSYPEGMIIYVDPDKMVTNGCRVVARANGEYTFKSYVEDAGKRFLKPLNPQYQMIDITEETHICGVIIGSYMPE